MDSLSLEGWKHTSLKSFGSSVFKYTWHSFNVCGTIRIYIFLKFFFFGKLCILFKFSGDYKFIKSILSNTGNCTQYFVITYKGRKKIYIYVYVYFLVYVYARSAASVVSDSATQGAVAARLLCPWDSPDKNTEWAAMPSSRGSSRPRDGTHISCVPCIAGGFFTAELLGKPCINTHTHKLRSRVPCAIQQVLVCYWF